MTESDWMSFTDPTSPLQWLIYAQTPHARSPKPVRQARLAEHNAARHRATKQKLRLFVVACGRRIWHLLTPTQKDALELGETLADELTIGLDVCLDDRCETARKAVLRESEDELRGWKPHMRNHLKRCLEQTAICPIEPDHHFFPSEGSRAAAEAVGWATLDATPRLVTRWAEARREEAICQERAAQAELLRDILGNVFRPLPTLEFMTDNVMGLAKDIDATRCFERLPTLADALKEAGCDSPDILEHCRGNGPHTRGCWVIDLLLGRS